MKKILILIFSLISFGVSAQADTTQYKIEGRVNLDQEKPYVILISIDGFRYDYAEKHKTKNILKLANSGVKAKAMLPSYPSNTFPNHYTLVTGMYPSSHGIVDNSFYDPKRNEMYSIGKRETVIDGSWYGGVPLWSLAENQGLMAASLFWVGSESNIGGVSPSYYYNYHSAFSNDRKVEVVKEWLSLPEKVRPHFMTLYFPEVDSKGHAFGPDSPECLEAIAEVDRTIGKLVEEVNSLGLKNVNYVLVSDHGMIQVDTKDLLNLPQYVNDDKFTIMNSNTVVLLTAKDKKDIKPTFEKLRKEVKDYEVYLRKKMPKSLNFRSNDRGGDIVLMPVAPKAFRNFAPRTSPGKHGYNVEKVPEMKAIFYAWGPAFKENLEIAEFQNIHVYPMIAKILGLDVKHKIDGNLKVLKPILK